VKLSDLSSLIRSKNAGPFSLTFDIFLKSPEAYQRVKNSQVLNPELFARIYKCPVQSVKFFDCESVNAFKITIPNPIFSGDLGSADLHGGQQFAPLMDLEV
jgi:hypothetical protein